MNVIPLKTLDNRALLTKWLNIYYATVIIDNVQIALLSFMQLIKWPLWRVAWASLVTDIPDVEYFFKRNKKLIQFLDRLKIQEFVLKLHSNWKTGKGIADNG